MSFINFSTDNSVFFIHTVLHYKEENNITLRRQHTVGGTLDITLIVPILLLKR